MTRLARLAPRWALRSLAGCAVGPELQAPAGARARRASTASRAPRRRPAPSPTLPWWDVFDDPVLNGLVDEALRNGFDARLAAARVEEARALYGIARSRVFPAVGYEGGWQRGRARPDPQPAEGDGADDVDGGRRLLVGAGPVGPHPAPERVGARPVPGHRGGAPRRAALAVSDVAIAYFELRELDAELEIARRTTAAFQDTYDLFNRRLRGRRGLGPGDRARGGLAGPGRGPDPGDRARDRGPREPDQLPAGPHPAADPARRAADGRCRPTCRPGCPRRCWSGGPTSARPSSSSSRPTRASAWPRPTSSRRLSLTGLFGNVSPELGDLFSQGQDLEHRRRPAGPALPGRAAIKRELRGGPGALGAGAGPTRRRSPTPSARCPAPWWTGASWSRPSGSGRAP